MENKDFQILINDNEADWKAMYLHLASAVEDAVRILIKAQQQCEDMYIDAE